MRWKKLLNATAGMATTRPTAVATSASAMLDMTACGASACAAACATGVLAASPSASNAPTTPMTVPKRPMNGALLPSVPRYARRRSSFIRCERDRAGHRLLGGGGPAVGHRRGRRRPPPPRPRATPPCASAPPRSSRRARRAAPWRGRHEVVAQRPEVPGALEDDGDGDDAEPEHEPHDPGGAEADHDSLQPLDDVHRSRVPFAGARRARGGSVSRVVVSSASLPPAAPRPAASRRRRDTRAPSTVVA